MRLTGIQVSRGVESCGGLYTSKTISLFVTDGKDKLWWSRQKQQAKIHERPFPRPVTWTYSGYGWEPNQPLYAGEDVVDWLEQREKFHGAEAMVEAVNSVVIKMRRELRAEKRRA